MFSCGAALASLLSNCVRSRTGASAARTGASAAQTATAVARAAGLALGDVRVLATWPDAGYRLALRAVPLPPAMLAPPLPMNRYAR